MNVLPFLLSLSRSRQLSFSIVFEAYQLVISSSQMSEQERVVYTSVKDVGVSADRNARHRRKMEVIIFRFH
jgi:hypothetical protein